MKVKRTDRGFEWLLHDVYPDPEKSAELDQRVAAQSSLIGEYDDSLANPGSSYLWIGMKHHLNREEVKQLIKHLQAWLDTGSLEVKP